MPLEIINLTYSEMSAFKRCRRAWDYGYRQLIKPKMDLPPLFLGLRIHQTLANYYGALAIGGGQPNTAELVKEFRDSAQHRLDKLITEATPSQPQVEGLAHAIDLGVAMLTAYFAHATKADQWKVALGADGIPMIEIKTSAMLPTPQGTTSNKFSFTGKIDGLATIAGYPDLWLLEHKTARQWSEKDLDLIPLDPQILGYAWLCWKGLGVMPKGVIYNVIIKSQLRQSVKETVEQFRQRQIADYMERPEFYFRRNVAALQRETVEAFGDQLWDVAKDMNPNPRVYRTVGKTTCGFGCQFRTLCTSMDNAGIRETQYTDKFAKHEELAEDDEHDD